MSNRFAEILRELRQEKELSQQGLAIALAAPRYQVANWEQGRAEPDLDMLLAVAEFFEVTVDYLLGKEL